MSCKQARMTTLATLYYSKILSHLLERFRNLQDNTVQDPAIIENGTLRKEEPNLVNEQNPPQAASTRIQPSPILSNPRYHQLYNSIVRKKWVIAAQKLFLYQESVVLYPGLITLALVRCLFGPFRFMVKHNLWCP